MCILFFLFFYLFFCSSFCHTLTRISHGFTCIPHPDPIPTSLSTRSLWVFPVHQVPALVSCIIWVFLKWEKSLDLKKWFSNGHFKPWNNQASKKGICWIRSQGVDEGFQNHSKCMGWATFYSIITHISFISWLYNHLLSCHVFSDFLS